MTWTADDYRDAARSATSVGTRRALFEEADRIDRRDCHRSTVLIQITVHQRANPG